tara:strand:- start:283 stop:2190 length:1908 start_codon:yes stop_codon:yes gene_type:complete
MTLSEIFEGRLFSIPDYQRGYSWDKEQVQALLDDIELLFDNEHIHFTGTIVLTKNVDDKRVKNGVGDVYDIIDGQQRLTSLFILLRELIERLDKKKKSTLYQTYIERGEEGNRTPVFKLNTQIDPYFQAHVIHRQQLPKHIEFFSELRTQEARELSDKWLDKVIKKSGRDAEALVSLIISKLGFILYEPVSSLESGMMFEVINNRGKALTELEKVKNYLIYYAIKENKGDLRDSVDQCWGEILKNFASAHQLSHPDENTFLRAASVVFLGLNKTQASNIYQELKKKFPICGDKNDWKRLKAFVEFMRDCSFYYDALLNENSIYRKELSERVQAQIELLRSQTSNANILPVYFAVMLKKKHISEEQLIDILHMLEVFNFRVYMARKGAGRTDTGQGSLYEMASGFFSSFDSDEWLKTWRVNDKYKYKDNVSLLIIWLISLTEEYNPDDQFESGLKLEAKENFDFFKWGGLRYFLMNYEREINHKRIIKVDRILQSRNDKPSNDFYSVEHMWASANETGESIGNFVGKFERRRLGNFLLLELGINIQAAEKNISEKVNIYSGQNSDRDKSQLKQVHYAIDDFFEVKKQLDADYERRGGPGFMVKLHKGVIEKNEERMIKFATKRWSTKWAERRYWAE